MAKFLYVLNENLDKIALCRNGDIRSEEFEHIFQVTISHHPNLQINKLSITSSNINLLIERLLFYISIRNNDNPDYGIDWIGRFEREMMFNKIHVLGNELELFSGNEDSTILFLAQIDNAIKSQHEIRWILVDTHKELDEFIKLRDC